MKNNFKKFVFVMVLLAFSLGLTSFTFAGVKEETQKRVAAANHLQKWFKEKSNWEPGIDLKGKDKTILVITSSRFSDYSFCRGTIEYYGLLEFTRAYGFKKLVLYGRKLNDYEFEGVVLNVTTGFYEN